MSSITLVIDENISRLDANCLRVIMAGVEFDNSERQMIDSIANSLQDKLEESDKFHFTGLNPSKRKIILEQIIKLPIRAKIFCAYCHNIAEPTAKTTSLKLFIQQYLHDYQKHNIQFMVEQANEYSKIIKKHLLFDGSNSALSILPDAICHSYMRHISRCTNKACGEVDLYEEYLSSIVRTQIIDSLPGRIFLSRENKL